MIRDAVLNKADTHNRRAQFLSAVTGRRLSSSAMDNYIYWCIDDGVAATTMPITETPPDCKFLLVQTNANDYKASKDCHTLLHECADTNCVHGGNGCLDFSPGGKYNGCHDPSQCRLKSAIAKKFKRSDYWASYASELNRLIADGKTNYTISNTTGACDDERRFGPYKPGSFGGPANGDGKCTGFHDSVVDFQNQCRNMRVRSITQRPDGNGSTAYTGGNSMSYGWNNIFNMPKEYYWNINMPYPVRPILAEPNASTFDHNNSLSDN